jgi:hypothetical protein
MVFVHPLRETLATYLELRYVKRHFYFYHDRAYPIFSVGYQALTHGRYEVRTPPCTWTNQLGSGPCPNTIRLSVVYPSPNNITKLKSNFRVCGTFIPTSFRGCQLKLFPQLSSLDQCYIPYTSSCRFRSTLSIGEPYAYRIWPSLYASPSTR